jgi:hypothetical protein
MVADPFLPGPGRVIGEFGDGYFEIIRNVSGILKPNVIAIACARRQIERIIAG